jgi:hypothetical protein
MEESMINLELSPPSHFMKAYFNESWVREEWKTKGNVINMIREG